MKISLNISFVIILILFSVASRSELAPLCPNGFIPPVIFLQINDIYEIFEQEGNPRGGLARISTLKLDLEKQFPQSKVLAVLAGDFLSPSALGIAKWEGRSLSGFQMIEALNALNLDIVIPGNHEFDVGASALERAITESKFTYGWISSNVRGLDGGPYKGMRENLIIDLPLIISDPTKKIKIGFYSVTLDSNTRIRGNYLSPILTARKMVEKFSKENVDLIIGLTHLTISEDRELAKSVPETDLIIGGHEHQNNYEPISTPRPGDPGHITPIAKADSNGQSVYIHVVCGDAKTKKLFFLSRLQNVEKWIPQEEKTRKIVQKWKEIAFNSFRKEGFEPEEIVATTLNSRVFLDGTEKTRKQKTNLSKIIGRSYLQVPSGSKDKKPTISVYNAGVIRLDDVLPPGLITQYDILRILPFEGTIFHLNLLGFTIKKLYEVGNNRIGSGDYLQWEGLPKNINEIVSLATYRVATNNYLLEGRFLGLEFLNREKMDPKFADIKEIQDHRVALIEQLRREFPVGKMKWALPRQNMPK